MSCTRVLGANPGVVGQDWRPDVITYISRLADSSYLCLYNWLNIFVSQFQCAFPSGASFVVLCHVWHAFVSTSRSLNLYEGPVHTNALSNVYVFVVIENTSIDSRPHYRFYEFSTVLTKTFENDRIARYDVSWTLRTCYKNIHLRYFQSSFSFCCVFDRLHQSDMHAFSFWSTFKSVFKSMRFWWKRSAYKCERKA